MSTSGWQRWRTTQSIVASPLNSQTTTLYIPADVEIDVGHEMQSGSRMVRWDGYEHGMLSLVVLDTSLQDGAVPVS